MALLPVIAGQLPSGFCATDYQSILNEFSAHQSVNVGGASGVEFVASATKPTDQTVAWLRLDQFGRPERVYWFASGAWLSLHPLVSGLTQWYFDVLPNFTTFDGGDALALSAISGSMWQQAKNSDGVLIAAKFPIAAGTLPSGTVLAQGATGGEEKHVLTIAELAAHTHDMLHNSIGENHAGGVSVTAFEQPGSEQTASTGGDVAHNTMPPFVVGYLLQRTTRQFYAIT